MLQFVVLGIIPGTTIQLTFMDVVLISGTALLFYGLVSRLVSMHKLKRQLLTLHTEL